MQVTPRNDVLDRLSRESRKQIDAILEQFNQKAREAKDFPVSIALASPSPAIRAAVVKEIKAAGWTVAEKTADSSNGSVWVIEAQ